MTPEEITRYIASLVAHVDAYRLAADAPGLRKDAAKYLRSEADRLFREVCLYSDMLDREIAKGIA